MTASDDDQQFINDVVKAGKLYAAAGNEQLPQFVRDMAAHAAEKVEDRLTAEEPGGDAT